MSAHSDQNSRVLDQFNKQAASYAALIERTKNSSLEALLTAVKPRPTDRMLDVGCGTGRFAVAMSPFVAHIVGIDLTEAMLAQARRLQADAKIDNIEWQQGDVLAVPFADCSFDVVSCNAMLHHVSAPERVIAEMTRVCKTEGRIVAVDMTPHPEKTAALNAIEILRDPSHAHAMTHAQLRAIGADLGLTEIATREYEARIPLEAVLKTSFPDAGMLDRIRRLYRIDAESNANALGMNAAIENDQVMIGYPMSMVVWTRNA